MYKLKEWQSLPVRILEHLYQLQLALSAAVGQEEAS